MFTYSFLLIALINDVMFKFSLFSISQGWHGLSVSGLVIKHLYICTEISIRKGGKTGAKIEFIIRLNCKGGRQKSQHSQQPKERPLCPQYNKTCSILC